MISKQIKVFLSIDPGQTISRENLQFPFIEGVRCNTGAPIKYSRVQVLKSFQTDIHPIKAWVDLKCRELRLIKEAVLPHDLLELNHEIEVNTPTALYYNEGRSFLIIDEVIGGKKIKIKLPDNYTGNEEIKFGKGASLNIPDQSLKIREYMTENDKEYVKAAKEIELHNYLLSYVESIDDINKLLELDPQAKILAKIESQKGLEFVKNEYEKVKEKVNLVAAREDLYIELDRPHQILNALKTIIQKDPNAIVASLILESFLKLSNIPRCTDFTDLGFLMDLGYKKFLLGDQISQNEEALSSALGVFNSLEDEL
jgi:pyruvate kinase